MKIAWISLKAAKAFIKANHRHRPNVQGGIVALGCWVDGVLVGVVVLGRAARMDAPGTVCITRLCTDGYRNACSKLYSKAHRLAQALGFTKIKTFTTQDETGASLRAVHAQEAGQTKEEDWSRSGRARAAGDTSPKKRWIL